MKHPELQGIIDNAARQRRVPESIKDDLVAIALVVAQRGIVELPGHQYWCRVNLTTGSIEFPGVV